MANKNVKLKNEVGDYLLPVTSIGNVTNLQSSLDNKAASSHTHTLSLATTTDTSDINLNANSKYKITAGGSTYIIKTPVDTTYSVATTSANGLMSSTDKTKLNGIATGATNVVESTVSGWGFTKNAGTITGITMNGASKGTSGVVDLGTVLTSHQDISGKANDNAVVHKTGDETVGGSKTFSSAQYFENSIIFDTTNGGGYLDIISGGHFQIASGTGDLYLVGDSDVKLIGSTIKTENNFKFYTGAEDAEKGVIFGTNDGSGNVDYGSLSAYYHGANSLGIVKLNSTGNLDLDAIKGIAIKSGISTSSALPSYYAYLNTTALTAARTFAFPNKDGTFAMTSDIPDVSGKVNKSGDTMTGTLNMYDADIYFSGSDFPGICFNSSSDNRIWYDGTYIRMMAGDGDELTYSSTGKISCTSIETSNCHQYAHHIKLYYGSSTKYFISAVIFSSSSTAVTNYNTLAALVYNAGHRAYLSSSAAASGWYSSYAQEVLGIYATGTTTLNCTYITSSGTAPTYATLTSATSTYVYDNVVKII